jgi:hypothetical protein
MHFHPASEFARLGIRAGQLIDRLTAAQPLGKIPAHALDVPSRCERLASE